MADLIKPIEQFKDMLESNSIPYVELPQSTIIVKEGEIINIRQYHDDGCCLSSWIKKKDFFKRIKELEAI